MIVLEVTRKLRMQDHGGDTLTVTTLHDGDCLHSPDRDRGVQDQPCAVTIKATDVHLTLDELRDLGNQLVAWAEPDQG